MKNNERKISTNTTIKADNILDFYFSKQMLRHSVSFKRTAFVYQSFNFHKTKDNSYLQILNEKEMLNLKRSNSCALKNCYSEEIYYNLISKFEYNKVRRDKFGNPINKKQYNHKISFPPDDSLVKIRKVMSYSKVSRKLDSDLKKSEDGFCFVY